MFDQILKTLSLIFLPRRTSSYTIIIFTSTRTSKLKTIIRTLINHIITNLALYA